MQKPLSLKKTKIVATIGPATESEETIRQLIEAGMNIARFNTKHGTVEWHTEVMQRVKKVAAEMGQPIGILLDLQGPEIRITIPGEQTIQLKKDDQMTFTSDAASTDPQCPIIPQVVIDALHSGDTILLDDGIGEMHVVSRDATTLLVQALNDFPAGNRKTLNTPGVSISLPSLIERDFEHLDAAKNDLIDYVGLSFVRFAEDIENLRTQLSQRGLTANILAKIENQSALDHLDSIIAASDAVMVARGDLAVEAPYEQLTYWQKTIIEKSRGAAKPVITATQMLKSMVDNPRPTRAEVSDVAHAIYDGTDAVMLSEETTIGSYPVKAVATQKRIALFTEQHAIPDPIATEDSEADSYISHAVVSLLEISQLGTNNMQVDKIVCLTETGRTARLLSRFRPQVPVYALTSNEQTYKKLGLLYGVIPQIIDLHQDTDLENTELLKTLVSQADIATSGEKILVLHGTLWKRPGLTHTLSVLRM